MCLYACMFPLLFKMDGIMQLPEHLKILRKKLVFVAVVSIVSKGQVAVSDLRKSLHYGYCSIIFYILF